MWIEGKKMEIREERNKKKVHAAKNIGKVEYSRSVFGCNSNENDQFRVGLFLTLLHHPLVNETFSWHFA